MLFDVLRRMFASAGSALPGARPAPVASAGPSPYARGSAALERGRFDDAILAFGEALALAPDATARATAFNKRGVAHVSCGRRDEALADFLSALDEVPRLPAALVNVGNLLLEDGAVLDAIDYYDAAVAADDRYAPAFRHRGIALKRAGKISAGVRDLRTAGKLESTAAAVARRFRSNSARA